jgi:hypothetical protein
MNYLISISISKTHIYPHSIHPRFSFSLSSSFTSKSKVSLTQYLYYPIHLSSYPLHQRADLDVFNQQI